MIFQQYITTYVKTIYADYYFEFSIWWQSTLHSQNWTNSYQYQWSTAGAEKSIPNCFVKDSYQHFR